MIAMNNQSIYMNSENLKSIANKLNEKINEIDKCYSDIRKGVKEIDGSNDNWKGNNQIKFYNYYFSISKNFPENIKKFNDFYNFLLNAINSYENRDKAIDKDIDNNSDNFDV